MEEFKPLVIIKIYLENRDLSVLKTYTGSLCFQKFRRKEADRKHLSNSPCQEKRFAALTDDFNPDALDKLMIGNQILSFRIAFVEILDYLAPAELIQ